MSPRHINPDLLRAALRAAEGRLRETLKDLEDNDIDDHAVAGRLEEIEKDLRRFARAA